MEFLFLAQLSEHQIKEVDVLFSQIEFSSIEQYPRFSETAYPKKKTVHALMLSSDNEIVGYAQIKIKKHLLASVYFGPLVKTESTFAIFIKEIQKYCKKNFIPLLKIFPAQYTKEYSLSFWDKLKEDISFETSDKDFNWATLLLKINMSNEEILKNFTENHRRSIKKAINAGLKTEFITHKNLDVYNKQYCEMYASRGILINPVDNLLKLEGLFNFFENSKMGFIMGIKYENVLVGGVCISLENNAAFYLEGYSHPEYRKLPISHLAFYESIKIARDKGLNYFDFGGYAMNTKEGDQLNNINKFKKGFGGEIILYPKTMIFYNFLLAKWINKLFLLIKK